MSELRFTKLDAAGNDFIFCQAQSVDRVLMSGVARDRAELAIRLCARSVSVGADGFVEYSSMSGDEVAINVWNPDGTEATMCGNAARAAAYLHRLEGGSERIVIHHGVWQLPAQTDLAGRSASICLPLPVIDQVWSLEGLEFYSVFPGVQHAVGFVADVDEADVLGVGRKVRCSSAFAPSGSNVNFVSQLGQDSLSVRTYEKGVEAETLSCASGVISSVACATHVGIVDGRDITVLVRHGSTLVARLTKQLGESGEIWLGGPCGVSFSGVIDPSPC